MNASLFFSHHISHHFIYFFKLYFFSCSFNFHIFPEVLTLSFSHLLLFYFSFSVPRPIRSLAQITDCLFLIMASITHLRRLRYVDIHWLIVIIPSALPGVSIRCTSVSASLSPSQLLLLLRRHTDISPHSCQCSPVWRLISAAALTRLIFYSVPN